MKIRDPRQKAVLDGLVVVMRTANSMDGRWAAQSADSDRQGVYGFAQEALRVALAEIAGGRAAYLTIELGASRGWEGDVESLLDEAIAVLTGD